MAGRPSGAGQFPAQTLPAAGSEGQLWLQAPLLQQQPGLLSAQLQSQYPFQQQMAEPQAYGHQADPFYSHALSVSGLSPSALSTLGQNRLNNLTMPNSGLAAPPEHTPRWPPVQPVNMNLNMQTRPALLPKWQDSGLTNAIGNQAGGLQAYLPAGPSPQAVNPPLDAQFLAISRLRREMNSIQGELDRAEREVVRQKSLRETERLEFSEAKDRLKHSWANDREDFARVKTVLKMKNAEHHAQSGRLAQQLKDCEACNKALRELAVRHGVPVPMELENAQFKRLAAQTYLDWSSALPGASLPPSAPPFVYGRSSLDSYFQVQDKNLLPQEVKCQSLPDLMDIQLSLSSERDRQNLEGRKAGQTHLLPEDRCRESDSSHASTSKGAQVVATKQTEPKHSQ